MPNGLRYWRWGGHFDTVSERRTVSTSVDSAWEQEKLEATLCEMLENAADRASELQANTVRPA
jgi:hypothetical protein